MATFMSNNSNCLMIWHRTWWCLLYYSIHVYRRVRGILRRNRWV